jgi:hypothetical protein
MNRLLLALMAFAILATACYTGRPTRPGTDRGGDRYLILAAELESTKQQTLYDAIRQLRPFWLTRDTRGSAEGVTVYLDDQQIGGLSTLQRLPIHATARVRYMSSTEAQVRYGSNNGLRPAILVESARR